ncbi:MAG: type II secretion system F family protein [Thermoguttaceae bacterium]
MAQSGGSKWDAFRKLSPDEAAEFAARVAELAKVGVPLGVGLRTMAAELPRRRLSNVFRAMADRVDAGDDLLAVLQSQGSRLPPHLCGLIMAGVRSGRLAEVLEQYAALQNDQIELRRRVAIALAYPFILLLTTTALVAFFGGIIAPSFSKIFRDFGTALPVITRVAIYGSPPLACGLAILVVLAVVVPLLLWGTSVFRWLWPALYRVPMIGSLLRWSHLSRFSRLMGLLLDQGVPLPEALRLAGDGLRNTGLFGGCRRTASEVEQGRPLDESMTARRQFPATLVSMVRWGQTMSALPDGFRAAAEMFEGRVRSHGNLLETTLLPIMFLVIAAGVGFFVISLFLPLIFLVQVLS